MELDTFVFKFLSLCRTKPILPLSLVDSTDKQDLLLNRCLLSSLSLRFPCSSQHRLLLLQAIVRTAEGNRLAVSDRVYEELANAITVSTESVCSAYGLFLLPKEEYIVFDTSGIDNCAIVQNGSTGFVTWEAGKCLGWWFSDCGPGVNQLNGRDVLELGCGTGITSVMIAGLSGALRLEVTDYQSCTLDKAVQNFSINKNGILRSSGCEVTWSLLDFTEERGEAEGRERDVIIAADILYDENLIYGIINYLEKVKFNKFYLMSTIRSNELYNKFITELNASPLKYAVVQSASAADWMDSANSQWRLLLEPSELFNHVTIELLQIYS